MNKLLLKNAFIYPITQKPFYGDVLIGQGIILDIGPNLSACSQTKIYECAGLYLLPGFIDVHTHLGLYDEGIGWAGNDANDTLEPLSPHIRALDGVYPQDPAFSDAFHSGIQRFTSCRAVPILSVGRHLLSKQKDAIFKRC